MKIKDDGAADPQGRGVQDPRRASSSRATSSSTSSPGSPSAPELDDGETIPATQTVGAGPARPGPRHRCRRTRARTSRTCWQGYGDALNGEPAPGEDDDQDPDVKGQTAGKSLNDSLDVRARRAARARRSSTRPRSAPSRTTCRSSSPARRRSQGALSSREGQLKDLITNFNTTTGGARRRSRTTCAQTIHAAARACSTAANPALDALNASFPPTRALRARDHARASRETPATINAAFPWIDQTRALVSPAELQGLVARPPARPSPTFASSPTARSSSARGSTPFNRCRVTTRAADAATGRSRTAPSRPALRTTRSSAQSLSGLVGAGQNFDGNGPVHALPAGRRRPTPSTHAAPRRHRRALFGNCDRAAARHAPGARPPSRRSSRNTACYKQTRARPELGHGAGPGP